MTAVPLGVSSYARQTGKQPEILLVNMFVEKDPTNLVDQLVRLQRPGLVSFMEVGSGPIRGILHQSGTLGGDYFTVSGNQLYRGFAALGAIAGTGRVTMAANDIRVLIATGGVLYSYTEADGLTVVVTPDDIPISSVEYLNAYFILTQADSDRFYWIAPGEVDPDALSFASAEYAPDNLVRVKRLGDELWFFGVETTEVWVPTGVAASPFQRVSGRLYDKGCLSADTICSLDNTLFWVGSDGIAYRADSTPMRISDNAMEERIRLGGDLSAWVYAMDGHTFWNLTIAGTGTFPFDVSTQAWVQFSTYGRTEWQAWVGVQGSDGVIAGDDTEGVLWRLDSTVSNDNGAVITREMTGGVEIIGKPQRCDSLSLRAIAGWGSLTDEPTLQIRWSDDGGNTWSSWLEVGMGLQGQYWKEVVVRRLGLMRAPGRLFHLRLTDDFVFRVQYCRINEAFG